MSLNSVFSSYESVFILVLFCKATSSKETFRCFSCAVFKCNLSWLRNWNQKTIVFTYVVWFFIRKGRFFPVHSVPPAARKNDEEDWVYYRFIWTNVSFNDSFSRRKNVFVNFFFVLLKNFFVWERDWLFT